MQAGRQHRTLVVANRTAATPLLLDEIQRRAVKEPTSFVLLHPTVSSRNGSDWTLADAVKALRRAASGPTRQLPIDVEGLEGGPDAFEAVKQALADGDFDDVIISTLPKRTPHGFAATYRGASTRSTCWSPSSRSRAANDSPPTRPCSGTPGTTHRRKRPNKRRIAPRPGSGPALPAPT
jgi:hypothetical protein